MEQILYSQHRYGKGFRAGIFIAVGLFLFGSFTARAQEDSRSAPEAKDGHAQQTNPMSAPEVQRGQAQFQQSCAMCHGAKATGGIGPDLLTSSVVLASKYHNLVNTVIQDGRPDRGMPAFPQLTATNISDIVAFLHAQAEVMEKSGAEESEEDSLKKILTGNAEAGKAYFNGAGKCATCHSATGDLAHIAEKDSPGALQAAFIYPHNQNATSTAIVTFSSGKKMTGKLVHLDAFYVAILDKDGWYRSWPLQNVKVQVENPLAGHLSLMHQYTDKDIHDVLAYLETLK